MCKYKKIFLTGVGLLLFISPLAASADITLPTIPANPTVDQLQALIVQLTAILNQLIAAQPSTGTGSLSAIRTGGPAPLSVFFTAKNLTGSGTYFMDFGDGAKTTICSAVASGVPVCAQTWNLSHTYAVAGTYTATLTFVPSCPSGASCTQTVQSIGIVTITASASVATTTPPTNPTIDAHIPVAPSTPCIAPSDSLSAIDQITVFAQSGTFDCKTISSLAGPPSTQYSGPRAIFGGVSGLTVSVSYSNIPSNSTAILADHATGRPMQLPGIPVNKNGTVTVTAPSTAPSGFYYVSIQDPNFQVIVQTVPFYIYNPNLANQGPPPACSISVSPSSILLGQSAVLTWSSSAASAVLDPSANGNEYRAPAIGPSGSMRVDGSTTGLFSYSVTPAGGGSCTAWLLVQDGSDRY